MEPTGATGCSTGAGEAIPSAPIKVLVSNASRGGAGLKWLDLPIAQQSSLISAHGFALWHMLTLMCSIVAAASISRSSWQT